jgi:methionine synthase II (cobalamin-independent)
MAGTDILTDGCIRYDMPLGTIASWDTNNICYMGSLKKIEGPEEEVVMSSIMGRYDRDAFEKISGLKGDPNSLWWRWVAEEEPSPGKLGIWTETVKVALRFAGKRLKFSGPSAARAAENCINKTGKSDRDVFFALFRAQNKVLRQIADAGCRIIQVDYPFGFAPWTAQFHKLKKDVWKDLIEASNEELKGVNAHIWIHYCWGAPILYSHETPSPRWEMTDVIPQIAESRADCFQFEAANTDGRYLERELKAWKEYCPEKDYAVGAATPYDLLETAEDVDRIVQKALKYVPAEKLALTTDEGIAGHGVVNRRGAMIKMRLLAEAAKRARKKLK